MTTMAPAELRQRIAEFLAAHDPATTERLEFLRGRYDAGLAWVSFPEGHSGLGLPQAWQLEVDELFEAAGAPDNNPRANGIGLGMAAPTILAFGTEEQKRRFLRPLWTGEEIWCQLFSEPGAGSDLAALATRAVRDGEEWVINGQKVWTSGAHHAAFAILVARTDPDLPKHRGMTYFLCDVTDPGVDVRALRQITGEAECRRLAERQHRSSAENRSHRVLPAVLRAARRVGSPVRADSPTGGASHFRTHAVIAIGSRENALSPCRRDPRASRSRNIRTYRESMPGL